MQRSSSAGDVGASAPSKRIVLALIGAFSFASLVPSVLHLIRTGVGVSGADGTCCASDQLQYMAWIKQGQHHLLGGNLFDLAPPTHDFLHPMWSLSGLFMRMGAGLAVAYLLWKVIAVGVLGLGVRRYVSRLAPTGRGSQWAALIIGVFFSPPAIWLFDRARVGGGKNAHTLTTELQPTHQLWGYAPAAIAIGLIPLFLLGLERLIDSEPGVRGRSGRWYAGWTAAAGVGVSWLHPWQGETLLLIVAGLLVWERGARRLSVIVVAAITSLPLGYYFMLPHFDGAWRRSQALSASFGGSAAWIVIVMIVPLVAASLPAIRGAVGPQEKMLRLWPVAGLLSYFVLRPPFRFHALEGVAIPLAVLAVRGWSVIARSGKRSRALATAAVFVLVVPGTVNSVDGWLSKLRDGRAPLFTSNQDAAFTYLAHRPGGGVLSDTVPEAIPALTGHAVYAGHLVWTPRFGSRMRFVKALFAERLSPVDARRRVVATGAEWLIVDDADGCRRHPRLEAAIKPLTVEHRQIGCLSVLRLRVSRTESAAAVPSAP